MYKDTAGPQLRVLVVEDSEDDALLMVDELASAGFRVSWRRVESESALAKAVEQEWDIVFSDYSMPGFNGLRALQVLKDRTPDTPFIFVSGTIGEEIAVAGMRAGAQDYVMKGNLARLVPAVQRELDEARLRRERRAAEDTLRKLSRVVEQAADSVFITDLGGRIQYVNPAFERLTGYRNAEAIGSKVSLIKSGRHDQALYRRLWDTILAGNAFRYTFVNRRKDGSLFHEDKTVTPVTDAGGGITHFVSTGRDVTDRVRAEETRSRLLAILEATTDFVAMMDARGRLLYLNQAGRAMLGLAGEEDVSGRFFTDSHPLWAAQRLLAEALPAARRDGAWQGESAVRGHDGREIPVSQVLLAHKGTDGEGMFLSTIARDITERKLFELELQHQATHDALTGLPNRVLLKDHLSAELGRAQRRHGVAAVMFLDLDNFKRVNDSLGHAAGDALLCGVAQRLRECLRPSDTVARYGGDEFTVVAGDLAGVENVSVIAHKLRAAFDRPLAVAGQEVFVSFSIGISVYPHDGGDPETLLKNADTAMYRAKGRGPDQYQFYAAEMNARGHELLVLETDLRRALERNELHLYYQPQQALRSGKIVGFEALLRWQHQQRGLISPGDFIPMLEETGLIVPVGSWVLRSACAHYRECQVAGSKRPRVSVNVSARQFGDPALVEMVRQTLKEEKMRPEDLELEITETTVMHDVKIAGEILGALDALGVRLAVDDFGTGYSSLAYLKRFPLDVLKIDRAFVQDLEHDANVTAITEASVFLGHKLGLEVVAEGVETAQQMEFLRAQDCDIIQGFYLGRPMPAADVPRFLEGRA